MTHRNEVKEQLIWTHDKAWFGYNRASGFHLTQAAPPEAKESFRKWAAHQDELGDEGYDYTLEIA